MKTLGDAYLGESIDKLEDTSNQFTGVLDIGTRGEIQGEQDTFGALLDWNGAGERPLARLVGDLTW